MKKIELRLEVQDIKGRIVKVFSKRIESAYTPNKDMVFNGEDYTLEARNIYFDLDDGGIYVRFVEYLSEDEMNGWDFLENEDWVKL